MLNIVSQQKQQLEAFRADVAIGLSRGQKTLPGRWLYDSHNLFCRGDDDLHDPRSKSIPRFPLIKQPELTGILLLEKNLTSHAFTAARIAVLELLAAQTAISLQNTDRYSNLQERGTKLGRLAESNVIGILIGTLDGRVLEANGAFLQMVGCEQADLESGRL